MSRFGSWALSAVIHGALLVGAMLPVLVRYEGAGDGDDGGFVCRFSEATWRFDRIDRPADIFRQERPELPQAMSDEDGFHGWSGAREKERGCGPCDEEMRSGIPCLRCTGGVPWAKLPLGAYQSADCSTWRRARREVRGCRVTCGNDLFELRPWGSR